MLNSEPNSQKTNIQRSDTKEADLVIHCEDCLLEKVGSAFFSELCLERALVAYAKGQAKDC